MSARSSFVFNPLLPSFSENPYEIYEALRSRDEPFYFPDNDMWLLSRYDDISEITLGKQAVRSLVGISSPADLAERQKSANWHDMPFHERFVQFSLLDSDGDIHRRLRDQVFKHLARKSITGLAPAIQSFVGRLISALETHKEIDFIGDFAVHIPGFVIGMLLGAPEEDCTQLRIWSENIVQFFDLDRSDERKVIAETAAEEFYHYLVSLKAQRAQEPKDDLISSMIVDQAAGHYSDDEFISTCMLILMAGHGSTIDVLGSGMHTLLKFPDVITALRKDLTLLPNTIQEMFRYEPPLPFFHRHLTEETLIRGRRFPSGTTFGLLYGSANRDSAQFDKPNTFDIKRYPNRHLSFGRGSHLCLGNHLARLNMNIIFETLLRRFSDFQLVDEQVRYKRGLSVRGPESLPIAWTVK